MNKEFSPETVKAVLSGPFVAGSKRSAGHVDYGLRSNFMPMEYIEDMTDPDNFNAIGSGCMRSEQKQRNEIEFHRPLLDLDGGARAYNFRKGIKIVIYAALRADSAHMYAGKYGPNNKLRDVLGDNDIDSEIFSSPVLSYSRMMGRSEYMGNLVTALALRSKEKSHFDVIDSTQKDHKHLYIHSKFSVADHKVLIEELGDIGIINRSWQLLTEDHGMGILRTPWTKKDVTDVTS